MLILLKLEYSLITADLLNQNLTKKVMLLYNKVVLIRCCEWMTKKVMLLYNKVVLIRCCEWISIQSGEYNYY